MAEGKAQDVKTYNSYSLSCTIVISLITVIFGYGKFSLHCVLVYGNREKIKVID